jgi:hypothetical protein
MTEKKWVLTPKLGLREQKKSKIKKSDSIRTIRLASGEAIELLIPDSCPRIPLVCALILDLSGL